MRFIASLHSPVVLLLLLLLGSPATAATLEPLGLQDAQLLPKNQVEFRIGLAYYDGLHNLFQQQDLDRRVAELPSLSVNLGLGERVEAQLQYSYLYLREEGQSSNWGSGDLTIGLKVRLWQESLRIPALALRLAAKLPNADDEDDFGTDEADIFIDLLATRNFPLFSTYANLGLAILGDPRPHSKGQDDAVRYALGIRAPLVDSQLAGLLSIEGMEGDDSLNSRCAVRGGLQWQLGAWLWDLGGSVGLTSKSENWSLRSGLTIPFDLPSGW
ncbi:MAG: transporter [Syntrophotaleaceae bacterium]